MKKNSNFIFIANCTDGTKERRNLSPRVFRVKNTNLHELTRHDTLYISCLLNDYVPVLGVFE